MKRLPLYLIIICILIILFYTFLTNNKIISGKIPSTIYSNSTITKKSTSNNTSSRKPSTSSSSHHPNINQTNVKKRNILPGKWIDNSGSPNIIQVFYKNGIIHVNTHWSSGNIHRQTAIIKTINNEKRYYVSDSADDEYFTFGNSNEMRWFDSFGLFEVYPKKSD